MEYSAFYAKSRHVPAWPTMKTELKPAVLRQSTDKSCQVLRLIKTSVSLCSLITPHKDPWVASMSTLRLKWMFTSPNDYLSRCWVNAAASLLVGVTLSHAEMSPHLQVCLPAVWWHKTICRLSLSCCLWWLPDTVNTQWRIVTYCKEEMYYGSTSLLSTLSCMLFPTF